MLCLVAWCGGAVDHPMSEVNLNLSIPDPSKFRSAIDEAERHGLKVKREFENLGIASGSINAGKITALKEIDGIASVEPDRQVKIQE